MQRRSFLCRLGQLAAVCGTAPAVASWAQAPAAAAADRWPVAIFSKGLQTHSYEQMAAAIAQIGADGIEAPLRRGGHIEPADLAEELPKMIEALAKHDKRVLIAATDITTADDQSAATLRTLKANGVQYYRLGYYRYSDGEPRLEQVRRYAAEAKKLAALNEELGVIGIYQNHAGDRYLGSLIWDLAMLMEGIESPALGVALDLRHLRAEVGVSWRAMIDLIRPHVLSIFAKNATWVDDNGPKLRNVPLDAGMADRRMFRDILQGIAQPAPLSVHMEYLGHAPVPPGADQELIAACRHDVGVLRSWLEA